MAKKHGLAKVVLGVGAAAVAGKVAFDKFKQTKERFAKEENDSFGEAEESYENWIEKFIKYGTLSEVTREIVTELIEKIVVNGDKSIDIVFKYQSPYPVEKQAV